ncbi:MAG: WYL domain-containing protein, partial [Verrucomicrobia bacterium]|nr:WYL domain-containing protein [Verrucomicrobiota bacterium]
MKTRKRSTRPRTTGPRQGKTEILKAEKLKPASGGAAAGQGAVAMPNSVKRGAFDRMKKIFGLLQDGRYPKCTSIATEFEVSLRTAARDIEFMRDRWSLPIGYDDKRHGFFFTEKVERLPWVPVTEAELFAVCISQKVLELYHGMPFQKPLELAFAKITRSLDDEERYVLENLDLAFSFRPFAPEDPDLRVLELLTRAVAERRGLKFSYRKPGEKRAETRQVHPYHVMEYEGRLYLLAHDPARGAVRTFVLGRMSELALTGEQFSRPKDFDPKREFSTSLGVMKGKGDYQVVVVMDAWLTDILRGRHLHPSQVVEELPGGGSHLRLRLSCLEEIEQYVLSWG